METSQSSLDMPLAEPAANGYHPAQPTEIQTTEIHVTPQPATWQDPAFPQQLLRNLEDFSGAFRASVTEQSKLKSELHYTGQQMSQVFGAMSQLLDMLYDKLLHPPQDQSSRDQSSPQEQLPQIATIDTESLSPLTDAICNSVDAGFGEIDRRVHMSEERQLAALQATLQQLQLEREIQSTSFQTQIETMRSHTRIEFNRLLQVLMLGCAVAAAGAGAAFLYLRH
jgi:hypothetical protein